MILIAYDGSDDAKRAIHASARLLTEAATVLSVATPGAAETISAAGVPGAASDAGLNERAAARAREVAEEGARHARAAGLDAEPLTADGGGVASVAEAIVEAAEQRDARVLVVGRRGMSKVRSVMLGSISSAVVERSKRPVLVVPEPRETT